MTTRMNVLIQAACISFLLTVVAGTAAPQEQKEPAVPQQPETSEQPAQNQPGSLAVPEQGSAQAPAAAPKTPEAPSAAPPEQEVSEYTVKQGDTLWDISSSLFRDPFLWPFIWKANPSITNPDLIYPGNKLAIPSLAPIERALQAPREELVEKQAPVVQKPVEAAPPAPVLRESIAAAASRPKARVPAPEETAPEPGRKLILPEEQPQPIIDKYSMLSAGFVNDIESVGEIAGAEVSTKTKFGYDDVVFVEAKSPENVNIGDKFLIYAPLDRVKHPVTGESFGRLVRGLGILQITAKDPNADVLTARITLSFSEIEVGSLLTPYQEPTLIYRPEKRSKDVSGYILEVTDRRDLNGQTDVVYLDKGREDGIDPGDRFLVYAPSPKSGFPKKVIGEVQVFLVKDRTSTAVVQNSIDTLAIGDAVDFKK